MNLPHARRGECEGTWIQFPQPRGAGFPDDFRARKMHTEVAFHGWGTHAARSTSRVLGRFGWHRTSSREFSLTVRRSHAAAGAEPGSQ